MVITTKIVLQSSFNFVADPCYDYKNLSDASRKSSYKIRDVNLCDEKLPEGWYRFVGAAGTKIPTTRVPAFSCGTTYSGWLMREYAPSRKVCFSDRESGCEDTVSISEKECGSYHIYKLYATTKCPRRYCGSD